MLPVSLAQNQRNNVLLTVTWTGSLQKDSHGQKSQASMLLAQYNLKLSSKIITASNQSINNTISSNS